MSEPSESEVRVHDRRRFDADGNPKTDAEPTPAEPPRAEAPDAGKGGAAVAELEATRRRVDELARAYQALMQEREEFKQRLLRERERLMEVEKGEVAQLMLDVVDELDLALTAAPEESALARGVRMIRDGILKKLKAAGVERVETLGQPFDPVVAEASDMEVTTDPKLDHTVTAEVRAGYRFKDKVIRPARVRVAKYVAPANA
jgi:molecular chaperone GrpE